MLKTKEAIYSFKHQSQYFYHSISHKIKAYKEKAAIATQNVKKNLNSNPTNRNKYQKQVKRNVPLCASFYYIKHDKIRQYTRIG